jgi:hypothetical protein
MNLAGYYRLPSWFGHIWHSDANFIARPWSKAKTSLPCELSNFVQVGQEIRTAHSNWVEIRFPACSQQEGTVAHLFYSSYWFLDAKLYRCWESANAKSHGEHTWFATQNVFRPREGIDFAYSRDSFNFLTVSGSVLQASLFLSTLTATGTTQDPKRGKISLSIVEWRMVWPTFLRFLFYSFARIF